MDLKKIDPSFGVMKEFSRVTNGTTQRIDQMRQQAIFSDGILSAKHKTLAATLWAVSQKCEPCFKFYVLKAKELGATQEEVGEYLGIASTMGGCVGEMWALKAFKAFTENESDDAGEACCT